KIYQQKYPGVKIINAAVAGGAGSNAKAVLATRMQGGKPPDSFQVHAGQELISTWVKADKMEPITSIWNSEGWDSVMPKDLKTIVSKGSDVWSVPVNVHRGNALWVNLAKAGSAITPGTGNNLDNFLSALGKAKAAGMAAPLALGSKGNWQVTMLFENNLVAVGGANFYRGRFTAASSWTDPNIKTALNYVKSMLNYVNSDNATIDWDQASGRVQAGTSVVTIMGDWAKGYFTANNWKPDTDFTGIASPGTEKTYMIVCDTFGLPKGAPDRANASNRRTSKDERKTSRILRISSRRQSQLTVPSPGATTRERPPVGRSLGTFSWDRLTPSALIAPSIVFIAIFVSAFIGYTAFVST